MKESLDKAVEELKRIDHLVFVSLKYTRTADVLKSIIQRMINTFSFGFKALLIYAKEQKLIQNILKTKHLGVMYSKRHTLMKKGFMNILIIILN